jgi:hypothetical protein
LLPEQTTCASAPILDRSITRLLAWTDILENESSLARAEEVSIFLLLSDQSLNDTFLQFIESVVSEPSEFVSPFADLFFRLNEDACRNPTICLKNDPVSCPTYLAD